MTQLTEPGVNWAALAKSLGVATSARATTVEEFERLLTSALGRRGPSLIDAVLAPTSERPSVSFA